MGLQAIFPHKRRSFFLPGHKRYPYLLKGVKIERLGQAWVADITYIRQAHGFVYLVVVMDW
jgi:putative transposase